ncbi:MAG TPA: hypothetical protein VFG68_14840 [Fimbriiglobus sp.]|nr:hypothetical protein [Fimbriiglobus sp.]
MVETELNDAVRQLAMAFDRRRVRHALIGGLAVGVRSRPRATKDADFILHVPALAFPGLLEDLVADGFEIDVMDVVRRWSVEKFTVFYRGTVRVDWMQPILPLYAHVLDTAEPTPWLDTSLRVATAEGLILTKLVAFRAQDQADIVALLAANRDDIDLDLIRREWAPFAATEADRTKWLDDAIARILPLRNGP